VTSDATFITRLESEGTGPTLAVKDLIDVAGVPTTAGSYAVAERARPAESDAPLLAGARAAGARIVGKANLHELAFGAAGVNEHYGTPVNPFDATRVPGGSSSGSAVAVTSGEARIALGSDTGGSIRVPAAFCGIAGLKTTWGRVPLTGVWPLAPSLDTVGPMAADVGAVSEGMTLLEPSFRPAPHPARRLGRVRPDGVPVDPLIDGALDELLARCGLEVVEIAIPTWSDAYRAGVDLLVTEAVVANAALLEDPERAAKLSAAVRDRLASAARVDEGRRQAARVGRERFLAELAPLFAEVELLALPSVGFFPPPLDEAYQHNYTLLTMPVNLAGLPALSLPVATPGPFPASLQLVGPAGGEELLVATGLQIEAAAAR